MGDDLSWAPLSNGDVLQDLSRIVQYCINTPIPFQDQTNSPFRLDDEAAARDAMTQLVDVRSRAKQQKAQLTECRDRLRDASHAIHACHMLSPQVNADSSVELILDRFFAWLPGRSAVHQPHSSSQLRSIDEASEIDAAFSSSRAHESPVRRARRSTAAATPSYFSSTSAASSACPSPTIMPSTPRALPLALLRTNQNPNVKTIQPVELPPPAMAAELTRHVANSTVEASIISEPLSQSIPQSESNAIESNSDVTAPMPNGGALNAAADAALDGDIVMDDLDLDLL